jgi:hypothetical protein
MNLYYKGREVTPDLYAVEYSSKNFVGVDKIPTVKFYQEYFTGVYSYQKAVIWAHENFITGKIIYCLSQQWINVVDGLPVKRGVKKKNKRTDFLNNCFTPQEIEEPANMKRVI